MNKCHRCIWLTYDKNENEWYCRYIEDLLHEIDTEICSDCFPIVSCCKECEHAVVEDGDGKIEWWCDYHEEKIHDASKIPGWCVQRELLSDRYIPKESGISKIISLEKNMQAEYWKVKPTVITKSKRDTHT